MEKSMEKLITPEFRGSFVYLVEPHSMPGAPEGAKAKYSITIVLPKDSDFWDELEEQIDATAKNKWGKVPPRLKVPVKDGDDMEREEFANMKTVQATSVKKPGVVNADLKPIIEADEIYSGAWYRASVRCFAWDHPTGGKGVSVALDNVMKVKDGEAFSGRSDAAHDFSDFKSASKKTKSNLLD
jgi:hypothetical protein